MIEIRYTPKRGGSAMRGVSNYADACRTIESLFKQGVKSATAEEDGEVIGEIFPHPDNGRRTWYCWRGK